MHVNCRSFYSIFYGSGPQPPGVGHVVPGRGTFAQSFPLHLPFFRKYLDGEMARISA